MEEVVVRRRAWDCGSPLYDSFELASVYGLLDSNLMALPFAERSAELDAAADRAPARRTAAKEQRRRKKAAAAAARRTGKAVLRSIFRSVTCSRKL
ncbi:uncharacterized protein LOC127772598 [Oryza glaberrima]|uniref:Uncharacterized protein n=2 Tax=Oryza TaxID=4527 RepID=A0A0D3GB24_9ORYZ|nr:uncharacterized protein LOC127772598 [Oryza glaberrima]